MRPLPIIPRARPKRRSTPARLMLACPGLSPAWELSALRVLMKPKEMTKSSLRHISGDQSWKLHHRRAAQEVLLAVAARIGFQPTFHFPPAGDFHLVIHCDSAQREELKMLGVAISTHLPDLWFTLGRLSLFNGHFFRRERGYKLTLTPARDVHLTRPLRAELRRLFNQDLLP